jgi:transglutaminase-like putative cysteine protease
MGWRLGIVHVTRVSYADAVRSSFNEARMTPLTLPSQITLRSVVSAGPGVPVWTYCDYWGSFVTVFDIAEPHEILVIRAESTVETDQDTGADPPPAPSWDELTARAAGHLGGGPAAGDRLLEYRLPTPLTTVTAEVAAGVLREVRGADPVTAAEQIAALVREHVSYVAGATGVRTNAQDAWDQGEGVCQDMAHVTIALLRAAGLPARYVSGYLHADPDAAPGRTMAGQSHAWAEYWAGSWRACDPTTGAPVRERHVVVGRGRDYADVPPLKGIYHGTPLGKQSVTVEVTRLALPAHAHARRRKASWSRSRFSATVSDEAMCVIPVSGSTSCGYPAASNAPDRRRVCATTTLSSARPWIRSSGRWRDTPCRSAKVIREEPS